MIRPKIDTRPIRERISGMRVVVELMRQKLRKAESELLALELKAGIVRDRHPVGSGNDGGAP